jgi:Ca-activated chloride channel homolog
VVSSRDRNAMAHAAFADLADETGGRAYFAQSWQKQKIAFASIDDDLNHSYVLTYYSPQKDAPAGADSFRNIEVRIAGDEGHRYRVRTRRGYQPGGSD